MAKCISTQLSPVPARLDDRPVKKRIALVVLATDHTTERDFARICPPDWVGVYVNRLQFQNPTTRASLKKTGPRLTKAASLILPDESVDVIAYACTSASIVLGDDAVSRYLDVAKPSAPCVTPSSAAFSAFDALGVKRVSLVTPYSREITEEMAQYFTKNGTEVVNASCLGLTDDREMCRVSHSSIIEASIAACDDKADALFLSCTGLRALTCLQQIEDLLGKPVISSNQAMIWKCLRQVGMLAPVPGYGQLFRL